MRAPSGHYFSLQHRHIFKTYRTHITVVNVTRLYFHQSAVHIFYAYLILAYHFLELRPHFVFVEFGGGKIRTKHKGRHPSVWIETPRKRVKHAAQLLVIVEFTYRYQYLAMFALHHSFGNVGHSEA
jgi:hypothetical protein